MLALTGAKFMLSKIHPTILLATHGIQVHEQCCQFLNSLGYRLETIYGEDIQNSNVIIAYFNG